MSLLEQNKHKHTEKEIHLFDKYAEYFDNSGLTTSQKLSSFSKYVRRQDLSRFLAKNDIFKQILNVTGSIVECGCFMGQGLMTFAHLSSIYEPYNHTRRIIGFDTFEGFPFVSEKDKNSEVEWKLGDLSTHHNIVDEISESIILLDENRPIGHLSKVELIKGDVNETIDSYLENNKHLIVSLLYMDFDIYQPTKIALEKLIPRIPKGGVIAFDQLNAVNCPGETLALMESLGINNVELRKTQFDPYISYAVI